MQGGLGRWAGPGPEVSTGRAGDELREPAGVHPALARAEARLAAAVGRIEAAVKDGGQKSDECRALRAECDGLRRELDEALSRHARLAAASEEVNARLSRVIGDLDELAQE